MLKGTKSTTLICESVIGDKPAVYMSAQIQESGKSNSTKTITDLELYDANRKECRKDMAAFDEMLWNLEDAEAELPVADEVTEEAK